MRTCSICKTEKNSADFKLKTNGCLSSFCRTCSALYQKEYQEKNKEKIKEKKKNYHTQTKEYRRWYTIKIRYGITKEDYEKMLLKQNGGCAICGKTKSGHKNTDEMVVDHCHKTKKVRGLLCNRCNTLLGLIDDNPEFIENITNYLNK